MTPNGSLTAARAGLLSCHECHLVSDDRSAVTYGHPRCPRCGGTLHARKPDSLMRTWALVITACILYIPANALPVMTTMSMGAERTDTILGGAAHLLLSGSWPLALIVFVASVMVPLLKIVVLIVLLVSVHRRSTWRPRDRARLYRITEVIGRWSMVDIYAVTVLVALVKLGATATVQAEAGAVFFGAVVVSTMLAAMAFDPRLIWDRLEPR